ncbi:Glycine receptor subunit alpha-2 [Amphibalanus amphitrite]|uniref:Glycine receptor subunit alpha-2 n=1 Tax=Amphibalanus amphitrite TaxID=1232801 RepID=A0A6A4V1Z1_AMPAM|nr:Glycine receptor subunit alpha-2 [Amphibalanus amphitrite]
MDKTLWVILTCLQLKLLLAQDDEGYSRTFLTAEENANQTTCRSQALYKVLPEGYDKEMPPLVKGKALSVYVFFWIISVTEINEMTQDFTVDMYFRMHWTDFRITYPACEESSFVILDREQIDQIWVPDIYFIQSKRSNRHEVVRRNAGLKLTRNNEVQFSERLTITKFCAFDFRFFPLDRQACSLAVESYDFSGSEIHVSFKEPGIYLDNSKFKIPQYHLSMVNPHDCSYQYLHEGMYRVNQSCIRADFVFDRQFSYYFIQMYLPSVVPLEDL